MRQHLFTPNRHSHRKQSGIVLVVALIMMAIVGIASTAGIKASMEGGAIATSLRSLGLADQAAETALRWCEFQTRQADYNIPTAQVIPLPSAAGADPRALPSRWATLATFEAGAVTVPLAVMTAAGLTNFPRLPRCLVELDEHLPSSSSPTEPNGSRSYLVTVRAFSPDYSRQGSDSVGSETWLQSNLVLSY
jgi:type IV pilus assembly protein PilX